MNCNGKNIEKKIAINLTLVRFFPKTEALKTFLGFSVRVSAYLKIFFDGN